MTLLAAPATTTSTPSTTAAAAERGAAAPGRPASSAPARGAAPVAGATAEPAASALAALRPDLAAADTAARVRAVPAGTEARGFVVYVGLDEAKAAEAGTSLGEIVDAIRRLTAHLAPSAETHAAVALAPEGVGGRDLDVVRLALGDPAAVRKQRQAQAPEPEAPLPDPGLDRAKDGVVIDISRKRVLLDNQPVGLTYKEFELLQYLVLREGRTVARQDIIGALWSSAGEEETPNDRTIDVHVRRLRVKLGDYQDIVRTVRGIGYRFDRHADVSIRYATTPSPDRF